MKQLKLLILLLLVFLQNNRKIKRRRTLDDKDEIDKSKIKKKEFIKFSDLLHKEFLSTYLESIHIFRYEIASEINVNLKKNRNFIKLLNLKHKLFMFIYLNSYLRHGIAQIKDSDNYFNKTQFFQKILLSVSLLPFNFNNFDNFFKYFEDKDSVILFIKKKSYEESIKKILILWELENKNSKEGIKCREIINKIENYKSFLNENQNFEHFLINLKSRND
jgi:hypothetical protein